MAWICHYGHSHHDAVGRDAQTGFCPDYYQVLAAGKSLEEHLNYVKARAESSRQDITRQECSDLASALHHAPIAALLWLQDKGDASPLDKEIRSRLAKAVAAVRRIKE